MSISTKDDFYSFCTSGTLAKLEKSKKYAVYFIEEAKLLKEGEHIGIEIGEKKGKEEGLKEGKIEIAKNAIKEGLSTDLIVKLTGLTEKEIKKFQNLTNQ